MIRAGSGRSLSRPGPTRPSRSRRRAATGPAAGALLIAVAAALWVGCRQEPAGQTVSSVGVSGALELTVAAASSTTARPTAVAAAEPSAPPTSQPSAGSDSSAPAGRAGPPPPAATPARVRVPELGVDAAVIPVGVDGNGDVQVPDDVGTVGWYRFGPVPGATGSAVLVGHVDDHLQGVGVLARIGDLNPGDRIEIVDDNGGARTFAVVSREQWAKDGTPMARLFDRGGQARLVLMTCGGVFDRSRLSYDDNIAVTAVPVT